MPFSKSTKKKLKQPYGETMYFIPNFLDYADEEKRFIGRLDKAETTGTPFSQLISYFYSFTSVNSDSTFVRSTGQFFKQNNIVQSKADFFPGKGVVISNLPYHMKKKVVEPKYAPNGVETGHEEKLIWELKTKDYYEIPNYYNPYSSIGDDGKYFYNQFYKSSGLRAFNVYENLQEPTEDFVPPVSRQELERNTSINVDIANANRSHHITADLHTKKAIRSTPEYKNKKIREFTLMTLGDTVKVDNDGNEVIISADNNIIMVPIVYNTSWKPFSFPKELEEEKLKHLDKSLEIDPTFIKEYNKYLVVTRQRTAIKETSPLSREIEGLTEEQTQQLLEQIKNLKNQDANNQE